MKVCSRCGQSKPLDAFAKARNCADGHRGICKECRHAYQRGWYAEQAGKPVESATGTKVCRECGVEKPLAEFRRNASYRDRRDRACAACRSVYDTEYAATHAERIAAYQAVWRADHREYKQVTEIARYWANREAMVEAKRQWRAANPLAAYAITRDSQLQRVYGITLDEYEAIAEAQGGVCWICKRPPTNRALAVDHDHETGAVRALLCGQCNAGIGNFRENAAHLLAAIEYLAFFDNTEEVRSGNIANASAEA